MAVFLPRLLFNMAAGDTAIWLHNKLGSIDDLWSGKTISSQLSVEKLQSIQLCFHALQPHVKVKLMLSFLYIHRRNVEEVSKQSTHHHLGCSANLSD